MDRRTVRTALLTPAALVAVAVAVVAVVFVVVTGCAPAIPTETPGITGTVTSLVPGDARPASMLVEGGPQPAGAVSDKASVAISPSTQFLGPTGKKADPATITKGTTVKVWFEGPVAESYPVQGTAKVVQITAAP